MGSNVGSNVTMRTVAFVVSLILLSLLLILTGVVCAVAMVAWPPAGAGVFAAGVGLRLLYETHHGDT